MIPFKTKEYIETLVEEGIIPEQFRNESLNLASDHFNGYISIGWDIEDIKDRASDKGIKLTDEQAHNILDIAYKRFDANIGINWDVIDTYIDEEIIEF